MDYAKESLRLHGEWKGKIEVVTRVPVENKDDLSLAYTPGVAQPCLEIQKDTNKSYELTRRWNMCLVVTYGSWLFLRKSMFWYILSAVPLYHTLLSAVMVGLKTYRPPCLRPKSHHFDELR